VKIYASVSHHWECLCKSTIFGSPAGTQMDFDRNELWNRMDTEMGRKAISIPVFLVNEEQMDILYPPEFRRALDPKRCGNG